MVADDGLFVKIMISAFELNEPTTLVEPVDITGSGVTDDTGVGIVDGVDITDTIGAGVIDGVEVTDSIVASVKEFKLVDEVTL